MQTITKPTAVKTPSNLAAPRKPWWKLAIEMVICGILAIVGLEILFTLAGVGGQEYLQMDHTLGTKHLPNKHVIWRMEGFSADSFSSSGLRDIEHTVAKPRGVKRIAILGDSHSEGLQVPLKDTYPRRLEKSLNRTGSGRDFEVINFACSGYSTAQEYVQFKNEVVAYNPDVTVVLMHWGNMPANVCDPKRRRLAQPRPYFYLDGEGRLQQDNSVLDWYYKPGTENTPFAKTIEFLQRNSRIYGILLQTDLALNINEKVYFKLRGNFQRVLAFVQGKNPKEEPPGPAYPEQDPARVSQALVTALAAECASNNSKLVVMLMPDPAGASKKLAADLTALGKQHNFGFLDLSIAFKEHPQSKHLFLRVHPSIQGHKFISDTLQNYLTENKVL